MAGGKAPKRRGNAYERELVNDALSHQIEAERARGSDGRSLGFSADVDIVVANLKGQCKRRKTVADYLRPPESCDFSVTRPDRGESIVLMRWSKFLEMLLKGE